jgi:hypothetical protein
LFGAKLRQIFESSKHFVGFFPSCGGLMCQYVKERIERVKSVSSLTGSFEHSVSRGEASMNAFVSRMQSHAYMDYAEAMVFLEAKPQRTLLFFILSGRGFGPARRVISAQKALGFAAFTKRSD